MLSLTHAPGFVNRNGFPYYIFTVGRHRLTLPNPAHIEYNVPAIRRTSAPAMPLILIIDDDYEIVELLADVLACEGHKVETARDAAEGMQKARTVRPDLIILDYHMPGMTGAHLFESLRRNQATRRTPILFMSGEASPDDILKEVVDPQGASFLAKPVHLEDFRNAVRKLLAEADGGGPEPPP